MLRVEPTRNPQEPCNAAVNRHAWEMFYLLVVHGGMPPLGTAPRGTRRSSPCRTKRNVQATSHSAVQESMGGEIGGKVPQPTGCAPRSTRRSIVRQYGPKVFGQVVSQTPKLLSNCVAKNFQAILVELCFFRSKERLVSSMA